MAVLSCFGTSDQILIQYAGNADLEPLGFEISTEVS